ncbi:MAG: agmatinase [Vampirovibrionales bacterium]|nr:agmatinase [Vampirovibrionales bacterium]
MLSGPFIPRSWMGATENFDEADWVLVGMPYDGTTSYRPGTRFGPEAARAASWGVETYSPYQRKSLDDLKYFDAGELELPPGNRDKSLAMIKTAARETLAAGKHWLGVGGEHLVTWPAFEAHLEKYPDIAVVHFDAHADLRDDYLGEKLSHATVLRRIADAIGPERMVQIGIRSGPQDEFDWMIENETLLQSPHQIPHAIQKLSGRPIYLTIDLDVLDPSILPGTGTPEPGGMSFETFLQWLFPFQSLNIVAADVVELSPHYDPSGVSNVVAAKTIREVLLMTLP